jgi:hypothetical protein
VPAFARHAPATSPIGQNGTRTIGLDAEPRGELLDEVSFLVGDLVVRERNGCGERESVLCLGGAIGELIGDGAKARFTPLRRDHLPVALHYGGRFRFRDFAVGRHHQKHRFGHGAHTIHREVLFVRENAGSSEGLVCGRMYAAVARAAFHQRIPQPSNRRRLDSHETERYSVMRT